MQDRFDVNLVIKFHFIILSQLASLLNWAGPHYIGAPVIQDIAEILMGINNMHASSFLVAKSRVISCPAWLKKFKNIILFLLPKIQYFHCQNSISRPYLVLKYTHSCIRSLCPFLLNTGLPAPSLFVFSPYFLSLLSLLWRSHATLFWHDLVIIRMITECIWLAKAPKDGGSTKLF